MNDPFSLAGRHFLVTGGTRGIGRAITVQFARAGATVIANYVRDSEKAQELDSMAKDQGLNIQVLRADLAGKKGLTHIEEALDEMGKLDGLVHCAATGIHKPLEELTSRHFDWVFSLNVKAFFELVQIARPRFTKGASVIAVSSEGALRAVPYYTMVGSSKGALESMARHLAVELAPEGIRVNILVPGAVKTDAWKSLPDNESRLHEAGEKSPLGRLATAEDVAYAAQFLCSDASAAILGHRLVVDCGAAIVQ